MHELDEAGSEARAKVITFSLFPRHEEIIRRFAAKETRNLSNALQVIIDEWGQQQVEAPTPQNGAPA